MKHSLSTLTTLVQEIASSADAIDAKQLIVERLSELMEVPVCSLYLKSPSRSQLILAATHGLSQSAVGKIRLSPDEGLVGTIAATKHPLNLSNASKHEKFVYFPEAKEAPFQQFLGVPLIHLRNLVGVLVIQDKRKQQFDQQAEAFLVTIASQLAATLYSIQKSGEWLPSRRKRQQFQRLQGIQGAKGIGIGTLTPLYRTIDLNKKIRRKGDTPEIEKALFQSALDSVANELEISASKAEKELPEEVASIFTVYRMMLDSPDLQDAVLDKIEQGFSALWAVKDTALKSAAVFEKADDPYLQARGEDVKNIGIKLMNCMVKEKDAGISGTDPVILAGEMISITDLSEYNNGQVQGIVSTTGSTLSHISIIASALGIPAVMGVSELDINNSKQMTAVLDGNLGELILSPPKEMLRAYRQHKKDEQKFNQELCSLKDEPAMTQDGYLISLYANTGLLADVTPGLKHGAEGVGLYRSEIPFMVHNTFPTEEEQYTLYKEVIDAYSPRPVCMRTLDIGGDKQLPYYEIKEDNPYMGWRGIRFALDNTALQVTQIRAMIRAAHGRDNLNILIPMISRIDEIRSVKELINQSVAELKEEGKQVSTPKLGIMLEVPSAMLLLDKAAPYIDFVSIGSNDLAQYLTAIDRNNPNVSKLFDSLHPAMLVALQSIRETCEKLSLPVSLCGEMAADPEALILLVAMGFDRLSLSSYNIPKAKWLIRQLNRSDMIKVLHKANTMEDEESIRKLLSRKLKSMGIGF